MKKTMICFLCMLVAAGMLFAGGGNQSSASSANELILKYKNASLYPVAQNGVLNIWCGQDGNVADYAVNYENAALEKLTGVHINWTTAPGTQADMNVAFNLHIASGNYPDMYLNAFSTGDIMTYANDVFIPLNRYIDNTYWIKQYMQDMPDIRTAITAPDNNIYSLWRGLPAIGDRNSNTNFYKLWIYKPWLEMSGMDMPDTIDKLRDLLRYYRDHDMNGNGNPNDEIPIMGSSAFAHEGSDPTYAIMQAFQLTPPSFLWADENNNVTCVATTNEFRDGLKYLNSMFREGLIPEDIYTLTLNEYRDVVNVRRPEDMLVGVTAAPNWARFVTVSVYGERAYDEFTFMPVLKKDDRTTARTYSARSAIELFGAVTTRSRNPQLAISWIDACIDPEINRISNLGNEDQFWTRMSRPGEIPIITNTIPGTNLRGTGTQNPHTFGSWPFPAVPGNYYDTYYEPGTYAEKSNNIQLDANRTYMSSGIGDNMPALSWSADLGLVTEQAQLSTTIRNAIMTAYAEFILGRRDINNDGVWAAYLANLEALGLSRYLRVVSTINFGR